jgi:hypothetical protein
MKWTACRFRGELHGLTIEVLEFANKHWFVNIRNKATGKSIDHKAMLEAFDTKEQAFKFGRICAGEIHRNGGFALPRTTPPAPRPTAPERPRNKMSHGAIN